MADSPKSVSIPTEIKVWVVFFGEKTIIWHMSVSVKAVKLISAILSLNTSGHCFFFL